MIEARRPDVVVADKRDSETVMIDVPGDFRVKEKETEKITKYQDVANSSKTDPSSDWCSWCRVSA